MTKNFISLVIFLVLPFVLSAQWTAKQNLGTANHKRTFAAAVTLNNKVYVVGGSINSVARNDVWEYNIAGNSWTQKINFPGGIRGGMTAFAIGTKGYFMFGGDYTNPGNFNWDVWEYDPLNDTWLQKGNFPSSPRHEAFGFVIGNKGYIGTGNNENTPSNPSPNSSFNDFWEYDPATDHWTQRSDFPGAGRAWGIGVALNGKGYAGCGGNNSQTFSFDDFYEYDPATDIWIPRASYSFSVTDAMAFTLGNDIYVCGGFNFNGPAASTLLKKYDVTSDSWSSQGQLPGGITLGGVAVSLGNRVFLGTGFDVNFAEKNDWWEFAQLCQAPVAYATTINASTGLPCNGKLVVSSITNGCGPYTYSMSANAGSMLSGASGFTVNNLCPDTYSVYVKDNNCCGTSMTVVTIPSSLVQGIASAGSNDETISVFPNPNAGAFKISTGDNYNIKQKDIKILNILGQEVEATVSVNTSEIDVKLDKHEKGIYFLQIRNNGKQVIKKIQVE